MIVRTGNAPHQRIDFGAAPGRRLTSPGIAETFGYEAIPGRLVRPEPEPERVVKPARDPQAYRTAWIARKRATDPEWVERERAAQRERYARRKAAQES